MVISINQFSKMEACFKAIKYGVGIDMGKDEFYVCLSIITPRKAPYPSTI